MYGAFTLSGRTSQSVPLANRVTCRGPLPQRARTLVWAPSISLAATLEIDVSFFSSGYLDVSVHRVPHVRLWIQRTLTGCFPAGFPHSDISGSLGICPSPELFAAYHVFLRLLVPRHPPCALTCLASLTVLPVPYSRKRAAPCLRMYSVTSPGVFVLRLFFGSFASLLSSSWSAFASQARMSDIFRFVASICGFQGTGSWLQKGLLSLPFFPPSGDGEIRTLDPLLARQVLSQLSYTPTDAGLPRRLSEAIPFLILLFCFWISIQVGLTSSPRIIPSGLKWTRTTDLTLIRRAL